MTVVSLTYFVKYSTGENLLDLLETFILNTRIGLLWISGSYTFFLYFFHLFIYVLTLEIIKKLQVAKLNGKKLNPFLSSIFKCHLKPYPKLNHVKGLDYGMISPYMWKNYVRSSGSGIGKFKRLWSRRIVDLLY
jgi:hypothetical protein